MMLHGRHRQAANSVAQCQSLFVTLQVDGTFLFVHQAVVLLDRESLLGTVATVAGLCASA